MAEFRLIGWRAGLRSHAEWSRNSSSCRPNTYERCRELMRKQDPDIFSMFIIEEKIAGRWTTCDIFSQVCNV